jgi:hypothetical protein
VVALGVGACAEFLDGGVAEDPISVAEDLVAGARKRSAVSAVPTSPLRRAADSGEPAERGYYAEQQTAKSDVAGRAA